MLAARVGTGNPNEDQILEAREREHRRDRGCVVGDAGAC
jgi:hypothetical protein